ncbi:MAG: NUDIX domain-containing protein [Candidatus Paceibacterota bacterium]|jgi:8-oxo-dGTP pyrophosphatase MutT (NUDIX family)
MKKVIAYGAIPIFKDQNEYKILIVKNTKGKHWGLPKGTHEKGETPLETATRELREETGIEGYKIELEPSFSESHTYEIDGVGYYKTNTYYTCFVDKMFIGDKLDEIDEARWVSFEEAEKTITHKSCLEIVEKLKLLLLNK